MVIVVTSDLGLSGGLPDHVVVADPGLGLNPAAAAGIAWAGTSLPASPVAVLTGDLPGLRSHDLSFALKLAGVDRLSFVPDYSGTGTTMIAGLPGARLIPRFGEGSAAAHRRGGHAELPVPEWSTLRSDVDTVKDLHRVAETGLGTRTREILAEPSVRRALGIQNAAGKACMTS